MNKQAIQPCAHGGCRNFAVEDRYCPIHTTTLGERVLAVVFGASLLSGVVLVDLGDIPRVGRYLTLIGYMGIGATAGLKLWRSSRDQG